MNTTLVETNDKLLYLASKDPAGNYGVLKASGYFYNDGTGRLVRYFNKCWKEIKPTKTAEYTAVMETLDSKSKLNYSHIEYVLGCMGKNTMYGKEYY